MAENNVKPRTALPEAPLYTGYYPGTSDWMQVWKAHPELQGEMLSYQNLYKMGVNPIEYAGPCDDVFRVSNSALEAIASCSVMALLRYGFGVVAQTKVFAMDVGSAIHAALAHLFRTGDKPGAYEVLKKAFPTGAPPEPRFDWDNIRTIMEYYIDTFNLPYGLHPDLVELWYEQKLHDDEDGTIMLCGRIDAVPQHHQTKALLVMDNKTTGKITDWWVKKFRMASQFNGYAWAAGRFLGQQIPTVVINAIELPKLPIPGRKCKTHGTDYAECRKLHPNHQVFEIEMPPHMVDEWKLGAVFWAKRLKMLIKEYGTAPEGIKFVRMHGKYNNSCVFCPYIDFCLADRPLEWIGTVLQYREDIVKVEG